MPSLKELQILKSETDGELADEPAASLLLASHAVKDKRIAVRINSNTYNQFSEINRKIGATNSSVINMLVSEYILKYKNLLE